MINIQKSNVFLYTSNEQSEVKIIKNPIALKIKFLGISVTKNVQYLYPKNWKYIHKLENSLSMSIFLPLDL